jgi:integrase
MKAAHRAHITMAARAQEYLLYRRRLGFQLDSAGYVLLDFARFADRMRQQPPLTNELILHWATRSDRHTKRYQAERLSIVRGFARFLAAQDGKSQIPDARLLAGRFEREQPHIYTPEQLHQLLKAASRLRPVYPLRPYVYETLFGLLASTGLRVSEALALHRNDVDLGAGVIRIRQTKFRKSRLVPLHATVVRALRRFVARRDQEKNAGASEWFFVGRHGRLLPYSTVRTTFGGIRHRLGWRCTGTLHHPRIHDLRHSFACRRLLQWYRDGVDIDHAITSLSTYLGHGKVTDTYWYLSASGGLLSLANRRFERFASSGRGAQ